MGKVYQRLGRRSMMRDVGAFVLDAVGVRLYDETYREPRRSMRGLNEIPGLWEDDPWFDDLKAALQLGSSSVYHPSGRTRDPLGEN